MNWQFAGIVFCLAWALVCFIFVLIETHRIKQSKKQQRVHRGPFKDYKRRGVESVP